MDFRKPPARIVPGMDAHQRLIRVADRRAHPHAKGRLSELIVEYFIRAIRPLDAGIGGRPLATRRVLASRRELPAARRAHPWD